VYKWNVIGVGESFLVELSELSLDFDGASILFACLFGKGVKYIEVCE